MMYEWQEVIGGCPERTSITIYTIEDYMVDARQRMLLILSIT